MTLVSGKIKLFCNILTTKKLMKQVESKFSLIIMYGHVSVSKQHFLTALSSILKLSLESPMGKKTGKEIRLLQLKSV